MRLTASFIQTVDRSLLLGGSARFLDADPIQTMAATARKREELARERLVVTIGSEQMGRRSAAAEAS